MKHAVYILLLGVAFLECSAQSSHGKQALQFRQIGHQLLLASGDSTSRVLPVVVEKNRYKMSFDTEFALVPDTLISAAWNILAPNKTQSEYLIEVSPCSSELVSFATVLQPTTDLDDLACRRRNLDKGCYNIYISVKPHLTNLELLPTSTPTPTPAPKHNYWLGLLIPALGLLAYFFLKKRRKQEPNEPVSHIIPIGTYRYDAHRMQLIHDQKTADLTSKEANLLLMLHQHANTTVNRESILQKVWENEGDYVGRTLDVYISKLRKKLDLDPNIKIVNTRGVGYKLMVAS